MFRKFIDLLTLSQECVEFGENELGYDKVFFKDTNYVEQDINIQEDKVNIIKGGDLERNKKIVRHNLADVLIDPVSSYERPFDLSTATVARENGVAIGVTLKNLLGYKGMEKTQYFRSLEYLGKLVRRAGCNFIITSGAEEKLEMRRPRELASLGNILGFNEEESLNSVSSNVERILEAISGA